MKKGILTIILLAFALNTYGQILKNEWVSVNNNGCEILDPYYSDGVTMKWDGQCVNNKADGYGVLSKFVNGENESIYEGEYENGIREGKGTFAHKDGSVKKGSFVKGQLIGWGTMTDDEGNIYEGEFFNYRIQGKGVLTRANGTKSEGFFVSSRLYTGKITYYDGEILNIEKGFVVDKIETIEAKKHQPKIGERVTEFFNEDWERCKQKDASYYRLITYKAPNKPDGKVKDYYISGNLQSEFSAVYLDYYDEGKNFHEGEATWYFKNGNIEQKRFYFNNKINGENTFYYKNGEIKEVTTYDMGYKNGPYTSFYKSGNVEFYTIYEYGELYENKYIRYDENGGGALIYNESFIRNKSDWEVTYEEAESIVTEDDELKMITNSDTVY